jgi:hypothetical protein
MSTSRICLIVAAVLFVLGAIVVQGADLLGIHAEAFALVGLAFWAVSGAVKEG